MALSGAKHMRFLHGVANALARVYNEGTRLCLTTGQKPAGGRATHATAALTCIFGSLALEGLTLEGLLVRKSCVVVAHLPFEPCRLPHCLQNGPALQKLPSDRGTSREHNLRSSLTVRLGKHGCQCKAALSFLWGNNTRPGGASWLGFGYKTLHCVNGIPKEGSKRKQRDGRQTCVGRPVFP